MPNSQQLEFALPAAPDPLFQKLSQIKTLGDLKVDLVVEKDLTMRFVRPSNAWKKGTQALVVLRPDGKGGSAVRIYSCCLSGLQVFDGGENRRNVQNLREKVLELAKTL